LFSSFVQIKRKKPKGRRQHVVSRKPASRKKQRIGRDPPNGGGRGYPIKPAPADHVHQKKQQRRRNQVESPGLRQSPSKNLQIARQHAKENRSKRMPDVLDVASEILIHRKREPSASKHLVGNLQRHRFVAVGHRHIGQPLGGGVQEAGGEHTKHNQVSVAFDSDDHSEIGSNDSSSKRFREAFLTSVEVEPLHRSRTQFSREVEFR